MGHLHMVVIHTEAAEMGSQRKRMELVGNPVNSQTDEEDLAKKTKKNSQGNRKKIRQDS